MHGGGFYAANCSGQAQIINSSFTSNNAVLFGGGLFFESVNFEIF